MKEFMLSLLCCFRAGDIGDVPIIEAQGEWAPETYQQEDFTYISQCAFSMVGPMSVRHLPQVRSAGPTHDNIYS